jgi:hypothetical protein
MAKTKTPSKSNGTSATTAFAAAVQKLLAQTQALGQALDALDLPALTADERAHSNGRLRDGEAAAMVAIFDAMDAYPGVFGALAAKDGGVDPTAVETQPARNALADSQALGPVGAALATLAQRVSDGILAYASQAKDVSVPAYAIGKASAASDPAVRKALSPAITFYGAGARKRQLDKKVKATRAKKAAKGATAGH